MSDVHNPSTGLFYVHSPTSKIYKAIFLVQKFTFMPYANHEIVSRKVLHLYCILQFTGN